MLLSRSFWAEHMVRLDRDFRTLAPDTHRHARAMLAFLCTQTRMGCAAGCQGPLLRQALARLGIWLALLQLLFSRLASWPQALVRVRELFTANSRGKWKTLK